ncbi:MAG: hypothetical protein D3906_07725 [Candidatus Electrothrix sp. AUS1_2]|nr:hypothetical protein [Candidatus Electrothrix sp. AUS1_2]
MKKIVLVIMLSGVVMLGGLAAEAEAKEICPGPIPRDWVLVNTRVCAGCCTPGKLSTMLVVTNTEEMKIGSTITICPESDIPAGWAIVKTSQQAGGCGKAGQLVLMRTIEKLSDQKRAKRKTRQSSDSSLRGSVVHPRNMQSADFSSSSL